MGAKYVSKAHNFTLGLGNAIYFASGVLLALLLMKNGHTRRCLEPSQAESGLNDAKYVHHATNTGDDSTKAVSISHRTRTINRGSGMIEQMTGMGSNSFVNNGVNSKSNPKNMQNLWSTQASNGIPKEYTRQCKQIIEGFSGKSRGASRGFSQVKADFIAFHTFFLNRTTPGVYLEIGAYHPTKLSNSAFFDICLGWHGICVEPDPTKKETWDNAKERSCNVFRKCLQEVDATVCMGNLNDGITSVQNNAAIGQDQSNQCKHGQEAVQCTTFENMLETIPARSRISTQPLSLASSGRVRIDFVSLDVERHEMRVLKCFPFDKYDISMFLIETASNAMQYDWFMMNKGYLKWDELRNGPYPTDTLYVRRDILHSAYVDPLDAFGNFNKRPPDRFNGREIPKLRCDQS